MIEVATTAVATCDVCGCKQQARKLVYSDGSMEYILPKYWQEWSIDSRGNRKLDVCPSCWLFQLGTPESPE